MTTPDIFADGEGTHSYLNAPSGQHERPSTVVRTATIPATTASGTVIGLIPFNEGASINYGSTLITADLDTATDVTFTLGYVYDDNVTYTNDADAFITSSTALQSAAAVVFFNNPAGATWVAEADGFIAVTTGGGATTTEGDISINAIITYNV